MINRYQNIYSPRVLEELEVYAFLKKVKNPDSETRLLIQKARWYKNIGDLEAYNKIKCKLTCYSLNFNFDENKSNKTIKAATGYIYLDVDDCADIDKNNPLIFAAWRSLSMSGYGLLVKVDGLTLENFKPTYESLGKKLGIALDSMAAKATQYTIQSFDENVYINNDSTTYVATVVNTPISLQYKKEKKRYAIEKGENETVRYDNLDEIDFDGQDYLVFPNEKYEAAKAYIPKRINFKKRNQTLFNIGSQFWALNPNISPHYFYKKMHGINSSCCYTPMTENEVNTIISNIIKLQNPEPYSNYPRRVVFNPKADLSPSERKKIVNKVTGTIRSQKTLISLACAVLVWDYWILGRVTQKKLQKATGKNIKTIERYYRKAKKIASEMDKYY